MFVRIGSIRMCGFELSGSALDLVLYPQHEKWMGSYLTCWMFNNMFPVLQMNNEPEW